MVKKKTKTMDELQRELQQKLVTREKLSKSKEKARSEKNETYLQEK